MSSITITEAQGFSVAQPTGRYHLDNRPVDQFFEVLPMEPVEGHARRVNTVDASTLYLQATLVGTGGAPVASTLPTIATRDGKMSHFAARVEIDTLVADQYSSRADMVQTQLQVKVAAVLALFQRHLVLGDSTVSGQFDGLVKLSASNVTGADSNAANGGPVAQGEIEKLMSMVASNGGLQGRYLVMRSSAYHHLYRHDYGSQVFVLNHPRLGPLPAISGVPILLDDYIPGDQTKGLGSNLTTVFAVNLGRDRGLCGLFPAASAGRHVRVRGPAASETLDKLFYEVSGQFGLAAYQAPAVAALNGVDHLN